MAALPGLTLLECGIAVDDPRIVKAAQRVRSAASTLAGTYELALSILLLDRLGDPADRSTIQSLALRLLAGQQESGGWTYGCPILRPNDEMSFLAALIGRQGQADLKRSVAGAGSSLSGTLANTPSGVGPKNRTERQRQSIKPASGNTVDLPEKRSSGELSIGRLPTAEEVQKARQALPDHFRRLPALRQPGEGPRSLNDGTDNSNTQFAILGVWVASRHAVPVEGALKAIAHRFQVSQTSDGGWGYRNFQGGSPAMTGAGLLGLAVGLGLANPDAAPRRGEQPPPGNTAVEKGLRRLAQSIGEPIEDSAPRAPFRPPGVNAYFLWTVERVGMLYNLRHIDGKDWYRWGAQLVVAQQRGDGSWHMGDYPGSVPPVDTCLILLFLKRTNLVQDLTKRLEFVIDTKAVAPSK
jgi:hypothetical protein